VCHKESIRKYRQTKEGVATSVFNTQCANSVIRGHNKPAYTKDEFKSWLFNHRKFNKLFNDWVKSGYTKNLKPSPDRKNNDLGYSFKNLRLGTCIENIRGKRIEFKSKDLSLLHISKWLIKGYPDYYFTPEKRLFNSKTNRFSKNVVRCYSTGYNLNGKFTTKENLAPLIYKDEKLRVVYDDWLVNL
jgi:hypothetical protein